MAGDVRIRVIIASGQSQTRDDLAALLAAEQDIETVGTASTGKEAVATAERLKPDVILIDTRIPGTGGVEATEMISALLPGTSVIMVSEEGGADLLRKAMVAGARQFLLKPVSKPELLKTIHQVYQTTVARRVITGPVAEESAPPVGALPQAPKSRQVVAVYSPKGGVGCTTVASNVAVALRQELQLNVALVDGSLAFGDVGVFFDLPPTRSIYDLAQIPSDQLDAEFVEGHLSQHRASGVQVLMAPPSPEKAELISSEQVRNIIGMLRSLHDFVIVDTSSSLDERILTILDVADRVLLVFTLEITAIRDAKMFLDVAELLKFPPEKVLLVLTRAQSGQGISLKDVQQTLGRNLTAEISSDNRLIGRSINQGEPVVLGERGAQVSQDLIALARSLIAAREGDSASARAAESARSARQGRFRLFSR